MGQSRSAKRNARRERYARETITEFLIDDELRKSAPLLKDGAPFGDDLSPFRPGNPGTTELVRSVDLRNQILAEPGVHSTLCTMVYFNGASVQPRYADPVDLNELQDSLVEGGTFFIWTCTCGDAGCAGRFDGVRVTHDCGRVLWEDQDRGRGFEIQTDSLQMALSSAIFSGRHYLERIRGMQIIPSQNYKAFGLCEG